MSFFETFNSNLGSYVATGEGVFDSVYGNPSAGSAKLIGRGAGAPGGPGSSSVYNNVDTYTLLADAPTLYCNARFISTGGNMDWCMYPLLWTVGFQVEADLQYYLAGTGFGSDSGWVQLSFPLTGRLTGAVIDNMSFAVPTPGVSPATCGSGLVVTAYIDSITVGTPPTLGPGEPGSEFTGYGLKHNAGGIPGLILEV